MDKNKTREFNGPYIGVFNNHTAFPLGGIGAGMMCLEGTGCLNHLSLRHHPELYNEPGIFSVLTINGERNVSKILEGPVQDWKIYGPRNDSGSGSGGKNYGLPHCTDAELQVRFPFANVSLTDKESPLTVSLTAWSPFIPGSSDESSLPVAALEYTFLNKSEQQIHAVYSFHTPNFMKIGENDRGIDATENGVVLHQEGSPDHPDHEGYFSINLPDEKPKINCAWFRGGWFDPLTMIWKDIQTGECPEKPAIENGDPSPGASLYVPFNLDAGEEKKIVVMLCWYVPKSDIRFEHANEKSQNNCDDGCDCAPIETEKYRPWYTEKFKNIQEVSDYWRNNYSSLRSQTETFSNCFYDSTLPLSPGKPYPFHVITWTGKALPWAYRYHRELFAERRR